MWCWNSAEKDGFLAACVVPPQITGGAGGDGIPWLIFKTTWCLFVLWYWCIHSKGDIELLKHANVAHTNLMKATVCNKVYQCNILYLKNKCNKSYRVWESLPITSNLNPVQSARVLRGNRSLTRAMQTEISKYRDKQM